MILAPVVSLDDSVKQFGYIHDASHHHQAGVSAVIKYTAMKFCDHWKRGEESQNSMAQAMCTVVASYSGLSL